MLTRTVNTIIKIPIRLELDGADVTGKVGGTGAGLINIQVVNQDDTAWVAKTVTTHYTVQELGQGDYTITLLAASNSVQGALRIKYDSGDSQVTFKTEIIVVDIVNLEPAGLVNQTTIIAKTDNLPSDPASETNVDATEAKVDLVQLDTTAIKTKTDNLPNDPASTTNVSAVETKVDIVDTNVDSIKAKTDILTFTGTNIHSHTKVQDDLGLTTTQKADVQLKVTDSLNAYDSTNGVATQSSVDSIQNNTRFLASIPTYFIIPTSAENVYKMNVCFYDTAGNMEDPDSNDIGLDVAFTDGTDKNAILFKDYAILTVLDNSGISGYKKLEKEDTGKYFCYIKIASTEISNQLIYTFALDENAIRLYYTRSNSIRTTSVVGDTTLADNSTNKSIIAESLKEQDVSATTAVSGSIHTDIMDNIDVTENKVDIVDTNVDSIKAKTDNLPNDPASTTNVSAVETKVDIVDTNVDLVLVDTTAITAKTANLPASPANEVTVATIDSKVDIVDTNVDLVLVDTTAIKTKTDNLPNDPASTTNVSAVETKVDTLQTNLDDVPDKAKMKDLIFNKKVTTRHTNGKPKTVSVGSDDSGQSYGTEGTITTTIETGTDNVESEVIV